MVGLLVLLSVPKPTVKEDLGLGCLAISRLALQKALGLDLSGFGMEIILVPELVHWLLGPFLE